MDNRAIGIFDSGVGGLTVVSEVISALPGESIIYFGDTARVPYGSKSKETVTKFSEQIVRFLLSKNVKAIIIACNTASSNSHDELVAKFDIPLIEVVSPGVESCLSGLKKKSVGVIGTEATIRSGAYERRLRELEPEIEVHQKACPLFVPLAEEGWTTNTVAQTTAEIYLQELIDREIDSLILGCTHYPLLLECIQKTMGCVKIVNPAEAVANKMKEVLSGRAMLAEKKRADEFYVSDNTQKFDRISRLVLGRVHSAEKIDIEEF